LFSDLWNDSGDELAEKIIFYCFLMLSNMSLSLPSEATDTQVEATRTPPVFAPTLKILTQGTKTSTFALSNKRWSCSNTIMYV
jgi:hypothetical protein